MQKEKNLLMCPSCGSLEIKKSIMAPNIGIKSNQKPAERDHQKQAAQQSLQLNDDPPAELLTSNLAIEKAAKLLAKAQAEALKESIWVGDKFSQEARFMHYGETDKRQIHGHASPKEAAEMQEEGIEIAALPLPYVPPNLKN